MSWNDSSLHTPLWPRTWTFPDQGLYYTYPTLPMPPEDQNISQLETIGFAIRVVLFAICLIENSIAIFILCKNIKNGNKTFSQFMLINMACTDILTAIFYYPAEFVKFSHGGMLLWLSKGHSFSNALCKMYISLYQVPFRVVVLTLVALACNATRNSSSKGRKEHTRKFSAILTVFFWIAATGLSSIYFEISKVENNKCSIDHDPTDPKMLIITVLNTAFVVPADLILTILSVVVLFRVRRRKKELKRSPKNANKIKLPRRQRKIGGAKYVNAQELAQAGKWCGERHGGECLTIEGTQKESFSANPQETTNMETEEVSDKNGSGLDEEDELSNTSRSAEEENFRDTQTEAKIMSATSFPFVFISILILLLPFLPYFLSSSQIIYVYFCVQLAYDIYGAIKPGIYASADNEFRKRYKQLSPFACCCFRRIRCGAVQQNVGPENSRAAQGSNV